MRDNGGQWLEDDDPRPTPPAGSAAVGPDRRVRQRSPSGDRPLLDDEYGSDPYPPSEAEPAWDELFQSGEGLEPNGELEPRSDPDPLPPPPREAGLDPDRRPAPERTTKSRRPGTPATESRGRARRNARSGTARDLVRSISPRDRVAIDGGSALNLLVLACNEEDTAGIDLASGALVRARVPWPAGHRPDLAPFDVVEAVLADEPERDDLAQPEAVSAQGLPRHLGTLHGRRVRHLLHPLAAPMEEHVLGFPGTSAPYWEFRGFRPSLALLVPTKGPVLFRRAGDRSVWIRFGWGRSDNWLPVEDFGAIRALDAARRDRLQGKDLAAALGFKPHYLVASVSRPRDGHCYKTIRALVPRG
ncbi:MAG TPA: hypothetical protein VHU17_16550 [Acidimicrobiales bacterium]|nr:hypothetical protein [Acidimicrobiales bacterium]